VERGSFPSLSKGLEGGPDWRTATLEALGKGTRTKRSPWLNYRLLLEEMRRRIRDRYSNVIVIDAVPGKQNARAGKGKSTLGIQIARDLVRDRCGTCAWSSRAITEAAGTKELRAHERSTGHVRAKAWSVRESSFSARQTLVLLRNLPPGRCVLYDESLLGLLAQGGRRNEELSDVIEVFSIVRAKKISIVLCSQSIWMLDLFVREGLVDYWVTVTERGRADVEIPWKGQHYKRPSRLPYDAYRLSPIAFRKLPETRGIWPSYDSWKMDHINLTIDDKLGHNRLTEKVASKIAECPVCGLKGSAWNVSTHRCPGPRKAPPAAAPAPSPPLTPPPATFSG
jgi:hypothetical protein